MRNIFSLRKTRFWPQIHHETLILLTAPRETYPYLSGLVPHTTNRKAQLLGAEIIVLSMAISTQVFKPMPSVIVVTHTENMPQ